MSQSENIFAASKHLIILICSSAVTSLKCLADATMHVSCALRLAVTIRAARYPQKAATDRYASNQGSFISLFLPSGCQARPSLPVSNFSMQSRSLSPSKQLDCPLSFANRMIINDTRLNRPCFFPLMPSAAMGLLEQVVVRRFPFINFPHSPLASNTTQYHPPCGAECFRSPISVVVGGGVWRTGN